MKRIKNFIKKKPTYGFFDKYPLKSSIPSCCFVFFILFTLEPIKNYEDSLTNRFLFSVIYATIPFIIQLIFFVFFKKWIYKNRFNWNFLSEFYFFITVVIVTSLVIHFYGYFFYIVCNLFNYRNSNSSIQETFFYAFIFTSPIYLFLKLVDYYLSEKEINNENFSKLKSKMSRLQMNPHFVFNTINNIQSNLALKSEEEANEYITSFSKLLRATIDMSEKETHSIQEELHYITAYIKLQKQRLNNQLDYVIDVDKAININTTQIPCLIIQPIVENAILHGLEPKKDNRILKLRFFINDGFLFCEIEDNGIGRKASELSKKKTKGKIHALDIINHQFSLNNTSEKTLYNIEIIDLKEKTLGTKTILKLGYSSIAFPENNTFNPLDLSTLSSKISQ